MSIADNLKRVHEEIALACAKSHRNPEDITLVAVSKTKSVADILEALAAGQQHFGENRVEEAEVKIPQIKNQAETSQVWHMIGHIQSRKAKAIQPIFDMVHSVDSIKIAQKLSQLAEAEGKSLDILIEVNVSGEDAKYGFNGVNWQKDAQIRENLWHDMESLRQLPCLNIRGLMTMAPFEDKMEVTRPLFAELAALRDSLLQELDMQLPDLSMGMTNDYPIAIEEGATIIRVGRAIFGER